MFFQTLFKPRCLLQITSNISRHWLVASRCMCTFFTFVLSAAIYTNLHWNKDVVSGIVYFFLLTWTVKKITKLFFNSQAVGPTVEAKAESFSRQYRWILWVKLPVCWRKNGLEPDSGFVLQSKSLNTGALWQIRICNVTWKANHQAAMMADSFGDGGNKLDLPV